MAKVAFPKSKEMLKGLIELVPGEDIETLYNVVVKFIPEEAPLPDEIEAIERANKRSLCIIFAVESIDKAKLLLGLANEGFSDFEDCLQMECAKSYGAEYIVTRNVSDYSLSEIKAVLSVEYLEYNK